MTTFERTIVRYVSLTKEMTDRDAERRMSRGFETYGEAVADAEEFDRIITAPELRERWLPQRIVKATLHEIVTVEDVTA